MRKLSCIVIILFGLISSAAYVYPQSRSVSDVIKKSREDAIQKINSKKSGQITNIKLKTHILHDPQFDMEVARCIIPEDWEIFKKVVWDWHKTPPVALPIIDIHSKDGMFQFIIYPKQFYFYSNDEMQNMMYGRTRGYEIMDWIPLREYVTDIILPKYLTFLNEEYLIEETVDTKTQEQMKAASYNNAPNSFVFVNDYRFRCKLDDMYYISQIKLMTDGMIHQHYSTQTMMWNATFCFLRAPEDPENKYKPLVQLMLNSFKWSKVWKEAYKRFAAWYNEQAVIAARSQSSVSIASSQRRLQQTLNETSDIVNNKYWYRSSSQDRIFQNYHEYNVGVNTYADPYNNDLLEFDNTFQSVWTNGSGDYKMSSDPGYNPNIHSNENYYKLKISK